MNFKLVERVIKRVAVVDAG